jgi:hypothetical protein
MHNEHVGAKLRKRSSQAETCVNRLRQPTISLVTGALLMSMTFGPTEGAPVAGRKVLPSTKKTVRQVEPHDPPPSGGKTWLAEFDTSPFPYDGPIPGTNAQFLNASSGNRKGHRSGAGRVYWQDEVYRERRVLLHIPKEFDVTRAGVIVVFFHGHLAKLGPDILDRQKVPEQVAASGINAVLVAPQFAVKARDSSPGKFWKPGAFDQFIREASNKLGALHGSTRAAQEFGRMPIVIVAYSGGYLATSWCLRVGGVQDRIRGVVLMDALYGEIDKFANWIAKDHSRFFVSAYTSSTEGNNATLKSILARQGIAYGTDLGQQKWQHGVTFLSSKPDVGHWDFVTRAWMDHPIKNLLSELDEFSR